ncbi:multiple sugar transport system permease protein [Murinocardiopsis flavida]|uniref:Multiple sugar transport system permease protein n=1 Tax=Murinocardiopsis flavida TaxID=645275 RepID=A0A2P8DFE4_9ACTN|nr:sugar ABC transporter permease [Murinocardiopsis flavida]PSK95936.1 multiple sugar transport system permease protein [Murinocardiopsis flavida]
MSVESDRPLRDPVPARRPAAGGRRPGPGAGGRAGAAARRKRRGEFGTAALFASPAVIGLTLFTLFPIAMSLVISFFDWPGFGERSVVGFANYADLLAGDHFHRVVLNTLLFTVLYLPLNIVVSLGLAVWIATMGRGRQTLRVLFFIPVITPIVANVLVWRMIYQPNGAIDGLFGVFGATAPNFLGDENWAMLALVAMSVWQGFGYNMLIFSAAIDNIPATLNEAAGLDGAGPWARFRHITVPMISPAMFFASTMTLITTFQVFAQPYLLTGGGPGVATETLVLFIYRQGFSSYALGAASAAGWILFILIFLVTAVQFAVQRKWVNYDV